MISEAHFRAILFKNVLRTLAAYDLNALQVAFAFSNASEKEEMARTLIESGSMQAIQDPACCSTMSL